MTLDKILAGLHELVLRLANNVDTSTPPDGWAPHEWSYLKGIASAQILRLRDHLRHEPEP